MTSSEVIPYLVSLSGANQILMEYPVPKTCISPTPGTRAMMDWTFETR